MLGPIPNSLGAGAYNRNFFPHGLVTFQPRFIVTVRQEICVDGRVDSVLIMTARLNAAQLLEAGFVDTIPLAGEVVTIKTLDGLVVTIKTLDAGIEECS